MSADDKTRRLMAAKAKPPSRLALTWSDRTKVELDLGSFLRKRSWRSLREADEFRRALIGEWGHAVEWPSGAELGAETLWLETLTALGRSDTRDFLEWRLRHGLSLSKAAEALGVSRRMVAYYSNGDKSVPRAILLACKGWEVGRESLTT